MGICNISIKTDLKNKSYIGDKPCKQGDTLILEFNIFDNSAMADLTGFACDLRANKSDGKGYEIISNITVTTSTGKASIQCPSSLTQFAGLIKLELTFTNTANGLQKTTFDINIQVDKSVIGNDDGSVPTVIITALEQLNSDLAQITEKINEANTVNNTLTNTNNTANSLNTTLNNSIGNANTSKNNLDNAIVEGNAVIAEIEAKNVEYTQHINNADIHVTLANKANWNRINEVINIVDILARNENITDENGTTITEENLVPWTV
ncbi:hypothetical protein [Clostridium saccharoperbutylacetonicum]|uniref:hypothetical protein n=1 Tax=Clostridium saccharoperbutylacetonicum TaxID=36745 RepID=UPI0039ED800A